MRTQLILLIFNVPLMQVLVTAMQIDAGKTLALTWCVRGPADGHYLACKLACAVSNQQPAHSTCAALNEPLTVCCRKGTGATHSVWQVNSVSVWRTGHA